MARVRRTLATTFALTAMGIAPALAQDGTVVGVAVGGARTEHEWRPPAPTDSGTGLVIGAFGDAETPLGGLSIRGEAAWTRRAGEVELDVAGQPTRGMLRADYLTVSVHAKLARAVGPARVYVFGGPTLDQLLSNALDPALAQVLDDEKAVVFNLAVGAGLGGWLTDSVFLGSEARLTEGVGDAWAGGFMGARARSVEATVRLAVPLARLRGG